MKSWYPVLICMTIIFFLSSIPGYHSIDNIFQLPKFTVGNDDILHLATYFMLGFTFYRRIKNKSFALLLTALFCCLYGLSDEAHQLFVPFRSFSTMDLAMDTLGGYIGGICYQMYKK